MPDTESIDIPRHPDPRRDTSRHPGAPPVVVGEGTLHRVFSKVEMRMALLSRFGILSQEHPDPDSVSHVRFSPSPHKQTHRFC